VQYEENKALWGIIRTVMARHSRPKDGVASAHLCPAIHAFAAKSKTWMPATSAGMTTESSLGYKKGPGFPTGASI
jgi:hypothetical protein